MSASTCMEELCILSLWLFKKFIASSILNSVEFMATQSVTPKDQTITAVYDSHFQCFTRCRPTTYIKGCTSKLGAVYCRHCQRQRWTMP